MEMAGESSLDRLVKPCRQMVSYRYQLLMPANRATIPSNNGAKILKMKTQLLAVCHSVT